MSVDSFKSKNSLRDQIKSANESHKNRKYILHDDDGGNLITEYNDCYGYSEEEYDRYLSDLDYEEEFVKKYFSGGSSCYVTKCYMNDLDNYDDELPVLSNYGGCIQLFDKEDYFEFIDSLSNDDYSVRLTGDYGSIYDWYPIYEFENEYSDDKAYVLYCINKNNMFYHKVMIPFIDQDESPVISYDIKEDKIIGLEKFLENYENGNIPLKYFSSEGNFEKVKELVETKKNLNFNFTDDFEISALDEAIVSYCTHKCGHLSDLYDFDDPEKLKNKDKCEILKLLIKNGAYTLGCFYNCDLFILDLFIQARVSKEKLLIDLIKFYGCYINEQKKLLILVKELIRNGVSLNEIGREALLLAIKRDFYGIVEELLENGVVIDISQIVDLKKDMRELLMKYMK